MIDGDDEADGPGSGAAPAFERSRRPRASASTDSPERPFHGLAGTRRVLLDAAGERRLARTLRAGRRAQSEALGAVPAACQALLDAWTEVQARRRLGSEVLVNPMAAGDDGSQARISALRSALSGPVTGPPARSERTARAVAALEPAYPMLQAMAACVDGERRAGASALAATLARAARGELRYLRARDALIEANVGLVWSVALRHRELGLEVDDLVQEGLTGLMRAAEKFDPRLGHRFSTFAMHWIRRAVTKALADQRRTVRVPEHLHEAGLALARESARLAQRLHREPRAQELAAETGDSTPRVLHVLAAGRPIVRLDAPLGAEGQASVGDLLPAPESSDPLRAGAGAQMRERLAQVLRTLPERDATALRLRYGLGGGTAVETYEAVGNAMGLSREGARQCEARALRALRERLAE